MSHNISAKPAGLDLSRRSFLRAGAAGAATLTLPARNLHAAEASDTINVALIGCGAQGETLVRSIQKVSSVPYRFVAVCDLLENKAKTLARNVNAVKPGTKDEYLTYDDPEAMLKAHPEIDAVFVAAPDWLHAPFTRLCHTYKKQVYCEKMMSNSLDAARDMVRSQRESGLLLQIGHQRRSNPRYIYARNTMLNQLKVCGKITHAYAQWNRGVTLPIYANYKPDVVEMVKSKGYGSLFEFLNWRWYKKYGGGALSDLGAHQIDIFNWMFGCTPKAVTASGGIDYFKNRVFKQGDAPVSFEYPDNVIAVYEYDVPGNGLVRAVYQVLTTNSSMTTYEKYMGDFGTLVISELPAYNQVYREKWDGDADKWEQQFFGKGYLKKIAGAVHHKIWERPKPWYKEEQWLDKEGVVDVRASTPLDPYELPITLNTLPHTPHVENFLKVVHAKGKQSDLNCPVEDAYKCAVAVLKVNELVLNGGGRMEFKPEDFIVA